ncbi:MAG: hypothetical protein WBA55_05665 [Allopontixanthobacter sediminis]
MHFADEEVVPRQIPGTRKLPDIHAGQLPKELRVFGNVRSVLSGGFIAVSGMSVIVETVSHAAIRSG